MEIPKLKVLQGGIIMDNHPLFPPFFSVWNQWPHLRGRSLVIGYIGPRGSGKTTDAVRSCILDYLLKSRRVWSDSLPISIDMIHGGKEFPLRSIPIDDNFKFGNCYDGVVLMDEINEGDGDAYRSMSGPALELSYDLQELRKGSDGGLSKMDVIWTTQSEMFNMPRIRFQTDIIIKCADLSLTNKKVGMGEYSKLEIWDYSGIVTGKISTVKLPISPIIYTKPWWHAFKTGTKKREERREAEAAAKMELYKIASEMAAFIQDGEETGTEKLILWAKWGIKDVKEQITIAKLLAEHWSITPNWNSRKYKFNKELASVKESVEA